MKLYTRQGDAGQTRLFGGRQVTKDALRVEAYGTVDELNSHLGLALASCPHAAIAHVLQSVQSRLFELGADLADPPADADRATPAGASTAIPRIGTDQVAEAEQWIDEACAPLPSMTHFILPGGGELSARLHVARTVCRRAERLCVALARAEPVGEQVVIYLNRLSDLLFALARRANQLDGLEDVPWRPRQK